MAKSPRGGSKALVALVSKGAALAVSELVAVSSGLSGEYSPSPGSPGGTTRTGILRSEGWGPRVRRVTWVPD